MKFTISKDWSASMAVNEPDVVTAGSPLPPTAEALQASEPTAEEFLYAMDQLRLLSGSKRNKARYFALVKVAGYLYRKASLRAAGKDV